MTLLILSAIFCVLVVIARELRLLRKARQKPASSADRLGADGYKPRIFTFCRSGWNETLLDMENSWIPVIAGILIWSKFVLSSIPPEPWIKYPATVGGVLAIAFVVHLGLATVLPLMLGWKDTIKQSSNVCLAPRN